MKFLINESQYLRLQDMISEQENVTQRINNLINLNDFVYEYGFRGSKIIPSNIVIQGDLKNNDIEVLVQVGEIIYEGNDVTEFAKNYALYSSDFDQDTALAFDYKTFIAKQMNSKVLSLINRSISEFDVILELYG
jgi:hypothetical protein